MCRFPVFIFLSIALCFLTLSCSDSKISQCKKIIEIIKQAAQESEKNRQTTDMQKILQVTDAFDEKAKEIEAIKIEDKQLAQYQRGFAGVYHDHAQVTRNFISALKQKDIPTAQLIRKKIKEIGETEKKLVIDMNNYCQSNSN
jgi:hypothetical protein